MQWKRLSVLVIFFVIGCSSSPDDELRAQRHREILGQHLPIAEEPRIVHETPSDSPQEISLEAFPPNDGLVRDALLRLLEQQQRYYGAILYYLMTDDASLLLKELGHE